MLRADMLILGYCIIKIEKEDILKVANLFLCSGFSVRINERGKIDIPLRDVKKAVSLLSGRVKYTVSAPRGLVGFVLNNKRRIGALSALILSAALLVLSSDLVWDVRIEGADGAVADEIAEELSVAGLSVGKRWSRLDTGKIELEMLNKSDNVSWLNINRRGTVAYVKISDKELPPEEEEFFGYASIVAARDCVIEEIIVETGYPLVKKGESVRAGQVLISGIVPSELGGGFCYARGEVRGRYSESISVSVSQAFEKRVYNSDILDECSVKIFGFSLNIFKNYRQDEKEYDIIAKKDDAYLFKRLPISLVRIYHRPYIVESAQLSNEEMVERASAELNERLLEFLSDKEALRLQTSAEFNDDGYLMSCYALVSGSVADVKEFKVEQE